ncbi:phage tail protein (plasmid) [Serratia ureilytica]|uniref:CfaE/CblD family pilus tip adhesin n=1 Tax=Serratia ureilytica TaxID=300181 RepID=UPI00164D1927|nr:CfaE/CblD family pilus tip adhesin [Serratia ureilytica]QNL02985.1 phage tail protein [Serratia ureilytica]
MKSFCYLGLILGVLGAGITPCYAVYEAPVARNTTLTAKYDRMSIPSSLTIWNNLSGGSDGSGTTDDKWLRNTLVCKSTSDSTYGACARTSPVWLGSDSDANIALKFTRDDTSTSVNLTVVGNRRAAPSCIYPASSAVFCSSSTSGPALFTYAISQSELAKLTTPGVWRATLKQDLWQWTTPYLNTWTASIVLTVTDLNNQQVYFPAFPYTTPNVDLNLNNRPGTSRNAIASGSASLDMCLYDGSNSSSNRVSMLFSDEGASAKDRASGLFSVYRTGADKTQAANRIDYKVSVINPTTGAAQAISNGTEITWTGTNQRNIQRQVVLPGVPGASLCVPAPIQFITPAFNLADKAAGHYTGKLTVIYTPSTQSNVSR